MATRSGPGSVVVPFNITGIDHVVLRARDPDRLVRFYRDVLGCPVEREQAGIGLTQLRAGRCLIDVVPHRALAGAPGQGGGAEPNVDHVCLLVQPFDAERISAYLRANGARVGEVAMRYGAEGEGPSLYLQDPEGNGIELKAAGGPAERP